MMFARGAFNLKGFPVNHGGTKGFMMELWELIRGEGFVWLSGDGGGLVVGSGWDGGVL